MISFLLIILYIIYNIINYGIPKSISATYYSLKYKITFSIILLLSIIFSFEDFMLITPENFKFLPFLFLTGIIFVSAAPNFRTNKFIENVHNWSAIISFILSQIWVAIVDPTPLILWLFIIGYVIVKFKKYKSLSLIIENTCVKFWAELVMICIIFSEIIGY